MALPVLALPISTHTVIVAVQQTKNVSAFRLGNQMISLSAIAQFLLILLISILTAWGLRRFLSFQVLARLGMAQGTRESVAAITSYLSGTLLFVVLLQMVGINLSSLAVLAGSLGIGIGFGLQEITKNFTSGITLLIERKLKVGDFIELNELSGYIAEISLRSTVIRTLTQKHIVVPNSDLVSNQVINWTYSNAKGWISMPISVTHESDPILVIEILLDSAYIEETVSLEYSPEVYFTGITDKSLDFKLWVWSEQIDRKFITESSLNFIILQNLKQHGIRIASPRMDVWNRNPNVVISSNLDDYQQASVLQRSQSNNPNSFSAPVATRDLLRKIPYFQKCTELELRKLIEIGHRRRLKPSELLYETGDPGDAFYIILSGSVGYTLEKSEQTTTMSAGDFVGEFSLMLGVPRTVTVQAFEDTTVFVLSPQGFKKLLSDQPQLYDLMVEEMARHEEELSQQGRQLRELGLINSADYNKNPVDWIRKNLEKLFGL
ncbi:MAG: mechanosensitive ion channel domain-containing protein [Phormidesmis sp.]